MQKKILRCAQRQLQNVQLGIVSLSFRKLSLHLPLQVSNRFLKQLMGTSVVKKR